MVILLIRITLCCTFIVIVCKSLYAHAELLGWDIQCFGRHLRFAVSYIWSIRRVIFGLFLRATTPKDKKKSAKDAVALKPGTPLPLQGACEHYKKSYRWFRFSCCGKVSLLKQLLSDELYRQVHTNKGHACSGTNRRRI